MKDTETQRGDTEGGIEAEIGITVTTVTADTEEIDRTEVEAEALRGRSGALLTRKNQTVVSGARVAVQKPRSAIEVAVGTLMREESSGTGVEGGTIDGEVGVEIGMRTEDRNVLLLGKVFCITCCRISYFLSQAPKTYDICYHVSTSLILLNYQD